MTNSEDPIDTLTDDVARRMTEGAPAADFTARVLQRIDERQPRHRWRAAWVAVPLAAAAVVLIAMQVGRVKPGIYSVPSEVRLKPDATDKKPNAVEAPSMVRLTPGPTDTRPRITRPKRNVADRSTSAIDALAPPRLDVAPLDVAPLEAGIASPDPIEVEHLETIAPIAVTPLGSDESQRPRPQ